MCIKQRPDLGGRDGVLIQISKRFFDLLVNRQLVVVQVGIARQQQLIQTREVRQHGVRLTDDAVFGDSVRVDRQQADCILSFITQAQNLIRNHNIAKAAKLGAFAATELLQTLNALIGNISRALDLRIIDKQKDQEPLLVAANASLEEITRLSKTLQIVAMNASLEAQRAGDEGAAFGQIAREMRSLSDKGTIQASKLEQDLEDFKKAHVTATGRPV